MTDYIIFCGYAGLKGCVRLVRIYYAELSEYFNKIYLKDLLKRKELSDFYRKYSSPVFNDRESSDIEKLQDMDKIFKGLEQAYVGEGGILKTLYDMAARRRCGFEIEIKKVSTIQVCIELCEYFELNIYRLMTEGRIIVSKDPLEVIRYLDSCGVASQIIGRFTKGLDKTITDKEIVEHVNKPAKDEIFKVVKDEREDIIGN